MLPVGKGRPRFGNGHTYTPQKTKDAEELIAWTAKQAGVPFFSGPVEMIVECRFQMPQTWSKKKQDQFNNKPRESRPDIDNVLKLCGDALNGVAYSDDAQITKATISKLHSRKNEITITINGL